MIAWRQTGYVLADLFDYAGSLMAQHDRVGGHAQIAPHRIGMADARGDDPDEHFIRLGPRQSDFFDGKRLTLGMRNGGLNFHAASS